MFTGAAQTEITQRRLVERRNLDAKRSADRVRVVFLSEGYSGPSARADFLADVDALVLRTYQVGDKPRPLFFGWGTMVGFFAHHETLANATGAGEEPGGGELGLDPVALDNTIANIGLGINPPLLGEAMRAMGASPAPTLLVVLMPEPSARPSKARVIRPGTPVWHSDPTSAEAEFGMILLEAGPQDHVVVLREIGFAVGLRPEWSVEAAAPEGATYDRPADLGAVFRELGSNLIYRTDSGQLHYDRALDVITQGLPIADKTPSTATDTHAQAHVTDLFEGGAGYRHDVFRTALDCIMRRRTSAEWTGTGTDDLVYTDTDPSRDFCPACNLRLTTALRQRSRPNRSLNTQTHHFERITWSNGRRGESLAAAFGTDRPNVHEDTHPAGGTDHFWEFSMSVDEAKGLVFADLRDRRNPGSGSAIDRPVADAIEFRDFQVVIERPDGSSTGRELFDLQSAFDADDVELSYGSMGTLGQDHLWHHGFYLRATVEIAGLVAVTVEQSVCLRAGSNDFDPTKSVVAIKVYPELCFSWQPLQQGAKVTGFHGTVWQIVKPTSDPMMHPSPGHDGMGGNDGTDQERVLTTWFNEIDTGRWNGWNNGARSRLGEFATLYHLLFNNVGGPITFYAGVFGYLLKQEVAIPTHDAIGNAVTGPQESGESEMEIVGVRLPKDARSDHWGSWRHPLNSGSGPTGLAAHIQLDRETREGQYDNVHNHGWMGMTANPHPGQPVMPQWRRMAPLCGQACVHLHWRWLYDAAWLNGHVGGSEAYAFMGWGDDPKSAISHQQEGTPLVPPNQRVRVAITDPSTARVNATSGPLSSILPGTGDVHGVRIAHPLDDIRRALWYDVDIVGDIKRGCKQVILEQGWGYACDHATLDPGNNVAIEPPTITWLRNTAWAFDYEWLPGNKHALDDFEKVMMFIYDCWFYRLDGQEQVPQGDYYGQHTPADTMEWH